MTRLPLAVALVVSLTGCAVTTVRQCSVGVTFFGPVPIPTAGCELIFEPADEEEIDV